MQGTTWRWIAILALAATTEIGAVAHITGGGLTDNIPRVLPEGCGARIERGALLGDPLWAWIQKSGRIADAEMYRTFNCGIGMIVVLPAAAAAAAIAMLRAAGERAEVIGGIVAGEGVQIGG